MFPHRLVRAGFGAVLLATVLTMSGDASGMREIRMLDDCEQFSFNAVLGRRACVGEGDTTFQEFNAELAANQKVGAWRFNPSDTDVENGEQLFLRSRAGETHTFTKVAAFGGGFVPPLNAASGNPVPRPECAQVLPGGGLAPRPDSPTNLFVFAFEHRFGPTAGTPQLPTGETKWQCCIHPWMRTTINTK